ncbi:MAG: CRISPR-associated protein, partial [Bacteroidetes bacterium]
ENKEIDLLKIKTLLSKPHIQSEIEKIELYYALDITKVINIPDNVTINEL